MSELIFEQDLSEILDHRDYYYLIDNRVDVEVVSSNIQKVDVSESIKSLEFYKEIIEKLIDQGIHRQAHLVVIGGGCLSDLGGYIASTLFRGINWSVIPTTLLAQVDAAIGGKTAINFKMIKNMIGSFYPPRQVYINSKFLDTLDDEDTYSGLGEILKYGFLDKDIFLAIVNNKPMSEIIKKCALYKYKITNEDPREDSHRIILNLGHTFGHAIESVTKYPHGICVALGLELIIKAFTPHNQQKFETLLEHLKLDLKDYSVPSIESLKKFLIYDKKKVSGSVIQIIVPNDIGLIEVKNIELNELFMKLESI